MSTAVAPNETASPIKTSKVTGRRTLHFNSIAEIQAEAERLASGNSKQLGNWTLGQTLAHLALAMKMSLDGVDFRAPWFIRLIAPLIKKKFLQDPMKPGFKLPRAAAEELVPAAPVSTQQGLTELRTQIER